MEVPIIISDENNKSEISSRKKLKNPPTAKTALDTAREVCYNKALILGKWAQTSPHSHLNAVYHLRR